MLTHERIGSVTIYGEDLHHYRPQRILLAKYLHNKNVVQKYLLLLTTF